MYSFAAPGAPGQPDRDKQGIARARILVMTVTDEQLAQILTEAEKILGGSRLTLNPSAAPPAS